MSELLKAPRIDGAKIAVVLENKFIPEEIAAYLNGFPLLGGEVELVSRLWYGDYKPASTTFYSDVDPSDTRCAAQSSRTSAITSRSMKARR